MAVTVVAVPAVVATAMAAVAVLVLGTELSLSSRGRMTLGVGEILVSNRTLTLIEREDDTRSWRNFPVYFSHSTIMPCPPRDWRYIVIGC
jgi:hypothetical protein